MVWYNRNTNYERFKDDFFFDNRKPGNLRRDSSGFEYTRDQIKIMQYKNKLNETNFIRIFIYNVPNKFNVDDIYEHFSYQDVSVKDLWKCSHPDARRQSFVIKGPRDQA